MLALPCLKKDASLCGDSGPSAAHHSSDFLIIKNHINAVSLEGDAGPEAEPGWTWLLMKLVMRDGVPDLLSL